MYKRAVETTRSHQIKVNLITSYDPPPLVTSPKFLLSRHKKSSPTSFIQLVLDSIGDKTAGTEEEALQARPGQGREDRAHHQGGERRRKDEGGGAAGQDQEGDGRGPQEGAGNSGNKFNCSS